MKPGQASATAKVIAASTILLGSDPRTAALVAPGAAALCQQLLSGSRAGRTLAKSAAHPLARALWRGVEQLTLPGIMAHYWHRKRWIETRCRSAVAAGFERVVIIGAGFDTLGLRLADQMPQIEVIEIDHPATQNAKRQALAGTPAGMLAAAPGEAAAGDPAAAAHHPLTFVPLDLSTEPFPATLFQHKKSTVFVCEGVLMYLPPPQIARLLDALRDGPHQRICLMFSFMTRWPDGGSGFRPRSWWIERWLAWRSEPFTWALAPEHMSNFLADHGFRLMEMALTAQYSEGSIAPASKLEGENLVMCERE